MSPSPNTKKDFAILSIACSLTKTRLTLWVNGVGVDIEIDEPYTFENGTAKEIHYLLDYNGESIDKNRNDIFVANNWFVL